MNFTTKHKSNVTGIRRSVAKRPRRLWIGVSQARLPIVSTLLQIPPCQGSEHDFHIELPMYIKREVTRGLFSFFNNSVEKKANDPVLQNKTSMTIEATAGNIYVTNQ